MRLAFDGVKETDRLRFRILAWEFRSEIFPLPLILSAVRNTAEASSSKGFSVCWSVCLSFQLFDK